MNDERRENNVDDVVKRLASGLEHASPRHAPLSATLFQTVADNYTGSIIITTPDRHILYVNPALLKMTGYTAAEVLGKTPTLFKSGQTAEDVYRGLWQTVADGGIWTGEFINRRKDGTQYLESKTIAAIHDEQNRVQFYFAIGEDMQQRQRHQQHLDALRTTDRRTGLPDRGAFLSTLVGVLDQAHQEAMEATVLHIDLDDFLELNDRVGHDQAEALMLEMAERIKGTLRQADHLASLGGDTFAILLGPHEAGAGNAIHELSERVLTAIRQPLQQAATPISVTASIGIASFPDDSDLAGELLSRAINATEQAKAGGGNTFFRFDSTAARSASAQRELLNDLRRAIERDELVLYYQPQLSLFSGIITGLEALIRWQHPQRGLIPPSEFIPLAEQSRCIIDIGEWVLRESCRQMRAWLDAGLPPIKVAINLAAQHLIMPELPATIAETLALHRIEAHCLEIEITESAMMQDVTKAIRSTLQLKDVGVRISLDDFGTGYSSLAYLSRFPIDVVKIDQSFVRDITSNPVNAAIAQAIIAMSHKLNKTVLAEGVETEEQMQFLRRNESDEMQGYYFSRPVPAEGIARLLAEGTVMPLSPPQHPEEQVSVLFVDDENHILAALKRTLRREGYAILTAGSASEGFALLAKNTIQVVVSDQRMPEMNGTEFLARVKTLYPETVRMVLSGYSEISAVTDSINKGAVYRFMLKPWDDEQLKEEIVGALRHWRKLYGPKLQEG